MRTRVIRTIRGPAYALLAVVGLAVVIPVAAWTIGTPPADVPLPLVSGDGAARPAARHVEARARADFAAMQAFRPGYAFWQHVFTLRDGSIAYGSAIDGRLLAVFPAKGDWSRSGIWADPAFAHVLDGQPLARVLKERRRQVATLLESAAGPILDNSTRGDALRPNALRYGAFLGEWAAIYERFGVPAEIGLAQVILESGLNGRRRSEANAVGFCQWLQKNWRRLNYFSPVPIEGQNQTSQAPYCAAYLSVLATKYGSFIPALSEHNAGGTNVGRMLISGEYLGAADVRAQYFLGSKLARELRALPGRKYSGLHGSYGARSHRYAEMAFGNTFIVRELMSATPQAAIHAMRAPRAIPLDEIVKRTGLPPDEIRRYNPALRARVPARATLYLPEYVSDFGGDVAFWRRPAGPAFLDVLDDFIALEAGFERWDDPAFAPVLGEFRRRFRETGTEEGTVMDTVLAYVMDQAYTSSRRTLLAEFRSNEELRRLIDRGLQELQGGAESGPATSGY